MDCGICMEPVDAGERRPKVLSCGHTFCLRCLNAQGNRTCASCRKVFVGAPSSLPDNFALLEVAEGAAKPKPRQRAASGPRFWCRQCGKEATELCLDNEHRLCSLQKIRAEQSQPRVDAVLRGEASLEAMLRMAGESASVLPAINKAIADLAAGLKRDQDDMAAKRRRLEAAQGKDKAAWEKALEALEPSALSQRAALIVAALADPSCSVAVRGGGVALSGSVDLTNTMARVLVCRLLCTATQLHVEGGQGAPATPGPVEAAAAPRWQERSNQAALSVEEMARRMRDGSRVARGRDWPPGSSADGTPPGHGTVTDSGYYSDHVFVRWDYGGSSWYDIAGQYPLKLVGMQIPHKVQFKGGRDYLDLASTSRIKNLMAKSDLLEPGKLAQIRTLVGLHCEVCPPWSEMVLQQVSASTEVLDLVSPGEQHLEVARAMPKLRELHVRLLNATHQQLQMVLQTPKLVGLEVHCPFDAPLPLPSAPLPAVKLQWLRVGVYPLATALALVRANADTLEELELVAASTEPYGCPDLAGELRRCAPRKLRRLLLWRVSDSCVCRHDEETCKEQKTYIWNALVEIKIACKVFCSHCDSSKLN